jgi:hypothetical protein
MKTTVVSWISAVFPRALRKSTVAWLVGIILPAVSGAWRAPGQAPHLSDLERADIAYVHKLPAEHGMVKLDLTDPRQEHFLRKQYELAGITAQSNPELFKAIDEARRTRVVAAAPPPGPQPLALITNVTTNDQKAFVADALSTVNGGAFVSVMTLGLYDGQGQLLAPESKVEDYTGGQDVRIENEGLLTAPAATDSTVRAEGTWLYVDNLGVLHPYAMMSPQSLGIPVSIENQAPKVFYDANLIHVCVNRHGQIGGCDYDCNSGLNCKQTGQTTPATIMFPVAGKIVYPGTIAPIQFDGKGNPTNALSIITTGLKAVGGACVQGSNVNFFKDPNTKIEGNNNNTLVWNLNPAIFGTACYQANVGANYSFVVYVTVNGSFIPAFINNTGTPGADTVVIKPMEIFFGCVAEGTKVTLDNDMLAPIETIGTTHQILAGARMLPVVNMISGAEDDPMIRIETSGGNSLLLSRTHPVVTTSGVVLAYRLHIGDEVMTTHGADKLVAIKPEVYRGRVWNLNVGQAGDTSLTHQNSTFFANGILVGDSKMQGYWEEEDRRDSRTVLERLPKRWHQDYLNWLGQEKQIRTEEKQDSTNN